ncbi:DNA repair endonuclease XPF isoform X2 [Agrilus planipennis]|nr:DNA repair endonuclease XPF isoform X2 [Agrilus planipennis]
MGFGHVERVMRTLFVKELYLWPRFHSLVLQSLKNQEPNVIELHIPISSNMSKIQTCILDLINLTIKEIKRINKNAELQELSTENCLTKKFYKLLQIQLDCMWHQLSTKTKQLLSDLRTLQHLILVMLHEDPVTFYATLLKYRSREYAQISHWVLLEPAELLFTYSSCFVYGANRELNPEFCPKWNTLSEILKTEIPAEMKRQNIKEPKVLILCQDFKTCYQLNSFLTRGPRRYLFERVLKYGLPFNSINKKFEYLQNLPEFQSQIQEPPNKRCKSSITLTTKLNTVKKSSISETGKKIENEKDENLMEDELENLKGSYVLTMTQTNQIGAEGSDNEDDSSEYCFEPFTQMENMNLTQICETASSTSKQTVIIKTFKSSSNSFDLQQTLEEMQPNFIIMYHSNVTAVRNIEMHEARRNKDFPLTVYFLVHAETVEEQSYLTSLRKEKEAFEYLIDTKSCMVVPDDQDGKSETCTTLQCNISADQENTRQGGKSDKNNKRNLIIVDIREFQSELPVLIHKRGIDIEPLTITIGDYILTPEICVERKSISDLIGSLKSGRLYQQCTRMSRYYSKPMLLIEFNQTKGFSWQNNLMLSSDADSFAIQQKLILLTLHFPKLRLVWSPNPYATAQLFEELKNGKEQPDIAYATSLGVETDLDMIETKYNSSVYDFVQKLPGITSKNIDIFLRKTKNIKKVISLSQEELKEILGNSKEAEELYNAIHKEHLPQNSTGQRIGQKSKEKPFKFIKKQK